MANNNTESPSGYGYQFVVQVPQYYICSICHLAMRKPVQTRCGHRFCMGCLVVRLERQLQPKCPMDNESLTPHQVFEDVETEQQILSLKIQCPNHCGWRGELRHIKAHDGKCPLTIVPCSYVSIGCNFKGPRRYLSDHYKNNIVEHLDITTQQLLTLQDENINLKKQVFELKTSLSIENLNDLKKHLLELKASSIGLMTKDDQSHYSYTWKINDFSKQLHLAKQQGRVIILYSEPFYTHKYGYKLKLGLLPNGYGDGMGTHLSLYIFVMRGEYDAILTWPFNWKFKFTLLDQKPVHSMCKKISEDINPDTSGESFQRPTTDENLGYGYPKFVSHEIIKTENYVVDGVVFIKFELENPWQTILDGMHVLNLNATPSRSF